MDPVVLNVTAEGLAGSDGNAFVVRGHSPAGLVRALAADGTAGSDVRWVQILSPEADVAPLVEWDSDAPLDIVLTAPADQYTELYKFATLRDRHPIRVTISVVPGFRKALQVATALHFPVKLDVGQPDAALVDELLEVVDLYLHRTTVTQPVEFLHSVLLSFFHESPDSLWNIQEENPARYRFVPDETDSRQLRRTAWNASANPATFVDELGVELLAAGAECGSCEFAPMCRGYFKVPDRQYDCAGVRRVFGVLASAATHIAADLDTHVGT